LFVRRPQKPATTKEKDRQILLAYKDGMSWNEIADTFDISRQAVYRRLKGHIEAKKESETHCKNNQKS
jgi:predicted DNA-binding protein YlxM (UPF0122 family)